MLRSTALPLTLLHRHVFLIEPSDKCSLRKAVLEREQLIPGDSCGSRLQNSLGADGREVGAGAVAQRERAGVVLRAEETVAGACVLQLREREMMKQRVKCCAT